MAPNAEVEDIITMTSSQSKVHSLKAAIFHTMAYKLSQNQQEKNHPKDNFCLSQSSLQYCPDQDEKKLLNSTLTFIWLAKKSQFARLHLMLFSF